MGMGRGWVLFDSRLDEAAAQIMRRMGGWRDKGTLLHSILQGLLRLAFMRQQGQLLHGCEAGQGTRGLAGERIHCL